MIKLWFIAAFIMTIISCNTASKTTVGIHIEGANSDAKSRIVTKDSTYEVALDSTGSAVIVLGDNLKANYATINYGRLKIPVYIEPGKSFEVSMKFEGRRVIPTFTGEGAKKNEYLNSDIFKSFSPDFKADEDAFIASLAELQNKYYTNLDSLGFDASFNQLEKKRLHYVAYNLLPNYPSYHPYYTQDTSYKPSDRLYEEIKAAVQEDETLIDMEIYQAALVGLVESYSYKDMEEYDALLFAKKQLDFVQSNFTNPVIIEFLINKTATAYIGRSGVDHLDEIAPIFNAKVTNIDMKTKFDELCAKWAKIAKGQPSADFKYLDINGKEVSLADLAGKYVYIDMWATWCGPCCGELPHLKELEHKFKAKNINFVSISCDQDKAAWEKKVKDDKLEGIQLHNGGNNEFMDAYMVTGIPRFILLDREGKIVSADMSRPSESKTVETLNALEGI
ncbi:MAG: TlpA disulfide reductase family protein [Odoribacter sp.]